MKLRNKRSLPNRKALRLKGHDYSSAGYYFLTICCQNRECLFGKIENGEMILNDAGKMVEKWYFELENKYPDKRCHEMVIMPNHIHCIIENSLNAHDALQRDAHDEIQHENDNENLNKTLQRDAHDTCQNENDIENLMDALQRDAHVGTSLRGRPVDENQYFTNGKINDDEKRGHPVDENQYFTNGQIDDHSMNTSKYGQHNKIYGASISDVMDWFKTMTTNEYIRGVKQLGWKRFNKRFWQRSFNDKIIRTEYSLNPDYAFENKYEF